jgi:DNA-binding NarL/FixJ family response regulator
MTQTEEATEIRVAILEDQRVMRESLGECLTSAGMRVVVSSGDPGTFLSRIGAEQPTVAIVDLTLESEDGLTVVDGLGILREVHQWHPEVRTVVLSASRSPEVVERCYGEGASGYLYKLSVDVDAVVRAVQAAARGERMIPFDFLQQSPQVSESKTNGSGARNVLSNVTSREREVLAYVASGADNLKIATHLQITERTVKAHVSSLYRKLGPENRAQLALLARQLGVRPPTGV